MRRTLAIGDIHGAYRALLQVLERAEVTPDDRLVFLGDYVDGWDEVYQVIDKCIELSKTNECIFILGNHDHWFQKYIVTGEHQPNWKHGGWGTYESYQKALDIEQLDPIHIPVEHKKFFHELGNYHLDEDGTLFVHGGMNRHFPLHQQPGGFTTLFWDRDLFSQALAASMKPDEIKFYLDGIKRVFIGHTKVTDWHKSDFLPNGRYYPNRREFGGEASFIETIPSYEEMMDRPIIAGNVINLDTGAGFDGKLTIMDTDTMQFWQSDPVKELYPEQKGRTK